MSTEAAFEEKERDLLTDDESRDCERNAWDEVKDVVQNGHDRARTKAGRSVGGRGDGSSSYGGH